MITISPGQALLILIANFKHRNSSLTDEDNEKLGYLKKLYLLGAQSAADRAFIKNLSQEACLKKYKIDYENRSIIDEDSSRRYFEMLLAKSMLRHELSNLDILPLTNYFTNIFQLFITPENIAKMQQVFNGGPVNTDILYRDKIIDEYTDAVMKLRSDAIYKDLTE